MEYGDLLCAGCDYCITDAARSSSCPLCGDDTTNLFGYTIIKITLPDSYQLNLCGIYLAGVRILSEISSTRPPAEALSISGGADGGDVAAPCEESTPVPGRYIRLPSWVFRKYPG